jgi:hypothetical protein
MTEPRVNHAYGKRIGFGAASIALALFLGFTFSRIFTGDGGGRFVLFGIALVLWMAAVTLRPYLYDDVKMVAAVAALELLGIWLFLDEKTGTLIFLSLLFLFLLLFTSFKRGNWLLRNMLHIRFFRLSNSIVRTAMSGFALFAALYVTGALVGMTTVIPKTSFVYLFESAEPIVERVIPRFSGGITVHDAVYDLIAFRADPGATSAEIESAVGESIVSINERFDIELTGGEVAVDVLYDNLLAGLHELDIGVQAAVLILIGAVLFFTIKGVAFFANWIIVSVAYGCYMLLKLSGFFEITSTSMLKEAVSVR